MHYIRELSAPQQIKSYKRKQKVNAIQMIDNH